MSDDDKPDDVYTMADLPRFTGLKRTQILELRRNKEFPEPFRPSRGGHRTAWFGADIARWQQERKNADPGREWHERNLARRKAKAEAQAKPVARVRPARLAAQPRP